MAKITDPDKLTQSDLTTGASTGTPTGNVHFNLTNKTIELIHDGADGGLSPNELVDAGYNDGGVSLQALYSFIKERWKSDATLIKYPFPMEAITAEQFEFINGWTLTDGTGGLQDSKKLIRDAGWAERDTSNVVQKEYAGIISLGVLANGANAAPYYAFAGDTAKRTLNYNNRVNEAILIFDRTTSPITDYRNQTTNLMTLYVRSTPTGTTGNVTGYTFDQTTATDIGVETLATQAYRFPLTEAEDPNISKLASELNVAPYTDMRIEYYSSAQSVTAANTFNVGVIIDADINDTDPPSLQEIYEFVQNQLRTAGEINTAPGDESTRGELTDLLVEFVGPTLKTLRQADGDGVFIEGVAATSLNNVEFIDNSGTTQKYNFITGVNLDFNDIIGDDPNSKFFLFYNTLSDVSTSPPTAKAFGTGDAVLVTGTGLTNPSDVHTATATIASGNTASSSSPPTGSITAATGVLSDATDSGTWTVDDLIGDILYITTGSNAGKYYITDNDADTITIDPNGKLFDVNDTNVGWELIQRNSSANNANNPRVTFQYLYDANTDGGKAADIDASLTLVAIGLDNAQYATSIGNVTKIDEVTIPISNALERNYEDPQGV